MNAVVRFIALGALLCSLSSCSMGFKRDWKDAMARGSQEGVEGAWEGTWLSHSNAHTGKLRCVVGPDLGEGEHEFHYHATWKGFLSAAYRARHSVTPAEDGTFQFTGSHDMPKWAGGRYNYNGIIKGETFDATYRCSMDHGVFGMKRPVED